MQTLENSSPSLTLENTNVSDKLAWNKIIEVWGVSNESQKSFCTRNNISQNTFSYHRGRYLRERKNKLGTAKIRKENTFIPLTVKHTLPVTHPSSIFSIELTSGTKITFPITIDFKVLKPLFLILGIISC